MLVPQHAAAQNKGYTKARSIARQQLSNSPHQQQRNRTSLAQPLSHTSKPCLQEQVQTGYQGITILHTAAAALQPGTTQHGPTCHFQNRPRSGGVTEVLTSTSTTLPSPRRTAAARCLHGHHAETNPAYCTQVCTSKQYYVSASHKSGRWQLTASMPARAFVNP
jgi:hypothetical protein